MPDFDGCGETEALEFCERFVSTSNLTDEQKREVLDQLAPRLYLIGQMTLEWAREWLVGLCYDACRKSAETDDSESKMVKKYYKGFNVEIPVDYWCDELDHDLECLANASVEGVMDILRKYGVPLADNDKSTEYEVSSKDIELFRRLVSEMGISP